MASSPTELAVRSGNLVKVAVVSPYALDAPGGVQNQVIELTKRLGDQGVDAWAVGPGRRGPLGSRLLGRGISIPVNGSRAPLGLQPSILRRAATAVQGADVVHLHEPFVPVIGWALLGRSGIPIVGTFHADPSSLVRGAYRRLRPVAGRIAKNLSIATAVSEVAASAVRPFLPDVTIIPNAIDTAEYRPDVKKDPHRVAFLGRDEPRKGLDVLLAAWPAITNAVPDAELDVIGTYRSDRTDGVRFLGRVDGKDKADRLAESAIFVAPNLGGESFGITLLEGMAAGCAVVASDLPAFTAVGDAAVRYFARGNATDLAEAVIDLLLDAAQTREAGQHAVRRSQTFDWTTVLPAYMQTYESAVRGH
ncbi:MAG: glycosyltransferase family 4 protein [Acidimicrobiia bacterium]|nr:glycosyltransferase family 4 protein [Acidimicrobiia bacterium]